MKGMTLASPKGASGMATGGFPRTLSSMAASIVGLAIFLLLASLVLVSSPIGSTVQGYFYGVGDNVEGQSILIDNRRDSSVDLIDKEKQNGSDLEVPNSSSGFNSTNVDDVDKKTLPLEAKPQDSFSVRAQEEVPPKVKDASVISNPISGGVSDGSGDTGSSTQSEAKLEDTKDITAVPSHEAKTGSNHPGCDLYQGSWFYDSLGPSYTNNTCPVLTQMQNCQGNGRPDKEYENWRWKPSQCDLPRFDARKFLELMRGKTIAFIGDSVARNQMESMLCLLWQVETPKNRGNKRMQRFYFRSTSTMIVRIWSSWLVRKRSEPMDFAPEGLVKLHLDFPDDDFMDYVPGFDVIVLSSGHWFAKQSVYVLNNQIMGGQLWWPDKSRKMKVNNVDAFGISVETIMTALATHPNYTGITILRSFSPDHYEGGAWNTGGSCTGKVKPLEPGKLVENGFTNAMHKKQVDGFNRAVKKATNKSKLRLMDITDVFGYRHDGHPGPYRSPDPNKQTKRGPDGRPPPQDCLHWCMPGPVDTWNEFVLETIRREFEGGEQSSLQ